MKQKESSTTTIATSKFLNSFNQAAKYIRFERHTGVDIREQSRRNYQALLQRLDARTLVPEAERDQYGANRFSPDEVQFLRFWHATIMPLFTARHGTEQFAYIQRARCIMPVADRRHANLVHQNSRTSGAARQNYNYFVLSIGAKHPVPISVSNSKIITLHFNKMSPLEKQQYIGMFISGHDSDYQRDITYPIIVCGTTEFKVSYSAKAQLRTTTFIRADGTLITETLTPAQEIVAADPCIDVIFEWLGYKMIEYLRFIGGDFQTEILKCNDIGKITVVFQALFPSYRFPELKIPLKKIPIKASYVEVSESSELSYKEVCAFHKACVRSDIRTISSMINPIIASAPGNDDDTPLTVLMKKSSGFSLDVVQQLLDNNADPSAGTFLDSNLSRALKMGSQQLIDLLMRGSSHPNCRNLRLLPKVGYIELRTIIASHRLDLFEQFYPQYLKYDNPQKLLRISYKSALESPKKYPYNEKLTESSLREYQHSHQILERILADTDPNCEDEAEKVFCEAAQQGKLHVLNAFLQHPKININQTRGSQGHSISDYEGWSALHYACWKGHFEVVAALIDAGIAINAKTRSGMSALAIAERVLAGELDFLSQSERTSEQLTNQNMSMFLKCDIGKQQLSSQCKTNLEKIITILKSRGATRDKEAEIAQKTSGTHFIVAACITATFNNNQHVLLVRKKNVFDEPHGMYLFPGGFYNAQRDRGNFSAGAIREVQEETGIDLTKTSCARLATYKSLIRGTDYEHQFFHFDLGAVKRLPFCVAKSDIGEAQWVNFEQIESTRLNEELAMSWRKIPIAHSNAIILSALQAQKIPDEQAIIASQQLTTENNPANIGCALFSAFYLQDAYDFREPLLATFEELIPNVPAGFLQQGFNEMLKILRDNLGEDNAKICVQHLIDHMVKTGLCNIGDLRLKGVPLIHAACMSHKTVAISWLLEQGADVNAVYTTGLENATPLCILIMAADWTTARMVVERFGANITLGATTDTALTIACSQAATPDDFIEFLFDQAGVITDELLGTVVHELIRTKRLALLDKMLNRFPLDLNREYYRRQLLASKIYPILTAINIYSLECLKLLAEHGADLTLEHRPNTSLIQFANSMKRTAEGNRLQYIARLPAHPENQADPNYYRAMKSDFFPQGNLDKEKTEQRLSETEQEIEEINRIIEYLKSFLPPKPPESQALEELAEYMRGQWNK